MNRQDNVILTDVDGVLLNWGYAFDVWMNTHGYNFDHTKVLQYDIGDTYNIDKDESKKMVRLFNESAAIGFLPPLRDAIHYVKKLHEEHGFVFHAITSLSLDDAAGKLRRRNLEKLFGETVFEKIVCLDTGADKDEALLPYKDSGLIWVEDKVENAELGVQLGLDSILVEHGYNMDHDSIPLARNWKDIYNYIVGL